MYSIYFSINVYVNRYGMLFFWGVVFGGFFLFFWGGFFLLFSRFFTRFENGKNRIGRKKLLILTASLYIQTFKFQNTPFRYLFSVHHRVVHSIFKNHFSLFCSQKIYTRNPCLTNKHVHVAAYQIYCIFNDKSSNRHVLDDMVY